MAVASAESAAEFFCVTRSMVCQCTVIIVVSSSTASISIALSVLTKILTFAVSGTVMSAVVEHIMHLLCFKCHVLHAIADANIHAGAKFCLHVSGLKAEAQHICLKHDHKLCADFAPISGCFGRCSHANRPQLCEPKVLQLQVGAKGRTVIDCCILSSA